MKYDEIIRKLKNGSLSIKVDPICDKSRNIINKLLSEAFPKDKDVVTYKHGLHQRSDILVFRHPIHTDKYWDYECYTRLRESITTDDVLDAFNNRNENTDKVVEYSVNHLRTRSEVGIEKYNTTLHENNVDNYLKHLHDELGDALNYLSKIRMMSENNHISDEQLGAWLRNPIENNIKKK